MFTRQFLTVIIFALIAIQSIDGRIKSSYGVNKKKSAVPRNNQRFSSYTTTTTTTHRPPPRPSCPAGCQCISADLSMGDSAGLLVQCANTNFVDIGTVLLHVTAAYPTSDITWLVLYNNTFAQSTLRSSSFYDTGVTASLQYLAVEASNIDDIEPLTFSRLTALRTLSLRSLKLRTIRPGAFAGLNLEFLDLSGNNLGAVDRHFFDSMTVERLAINYANITMLTAERIGPAVKNLRAIEFEGNKLKSVHVGMEQYIRAMEYVKLSHNPWHCGPALLWLKRLYDQRQDLFRLESTDDLYCATPTKLTGRAFGIVTEEDITGVKPTTPTTSTTTTTTTTTPTTTSSTTTSTSTTTTTTTTTSTSTTTSRPRTSTLAIPRLEIDLTASTRLIQKSSPSTNTFFFTHSRHKTSSSAAPLTSTTQKPTSSSSSSTQRSHLVVLKEDQDATATPMTLLLTFEPTFRRTTATTEQPPSTPTTPKTTFKLIPAYDLKTAHKLSTTPKSFVIAPSSDSSQPSTAMMVIPIVISVVCVCLLIGVALFCVCSPYAAHLRQKHRDQHRYQQPSTVSQSPSTSETDRRSCSFNRAEKQGVVMAEAIDADSGELSLRQQVYEPFLQSSASSETSSDCGKNYHRRHRSAKVYESDDSNGAATSLSTGGDAGSDSPTFLSSLIVELRSKIHQRGDDVGNTMPFQIVLPPECTEQTSPNNDFDMALLPLPTKIAKSRYQQAHPPKKPPLPTIQNSAANKQLNGFSC